MYGITTSFDASNGIATITLAMAGRANSINDEFGHGLNAALDEALASPGLKGIVLATGHKDFCVGANIDGLYLATDAASFFERVRQLTALFRKLETCGKPVAAALTGSALGGGFELALACHHRVVLDEPRVQLGLPEVNLGLIPGAGGTQRVARLLGIQGALEVITQGKLLRGGKAVAGGFAHQAGTNVAEVMEKAVAWCLATPNAKQPWDRSDFRWPDPDPLSPNARAIVMGACAMIFKKTSGTMPAPETVVSVIQEGSRLSFDRAVELEGRAFTKLAVSGQAKDMIRTLWYHKNAADKHIGLPTAPDAGIQKITILGAGMMGAGLAFLCASKGYDVVLKDIREDAVERGLAHCRAEAAKAKHLDGAAVLARIKGTVSYDDVRGSDLVIEAVLEDIVVKHRVIREVEPLLAEGAIFASNTSALPITDLATASAHPERFIGLHYFSPVEVMPLVEIIKAHHTDEATLARCLAFSRKIGKTPIVVNDGYGFYTTRVFSAYILEGAQLVAEGHDPVLVEWAARTAGMVVPPLQVFDEVTLRLAHHAMTQARHYVQATEEPAAIELIHRMVEEYGRPGRIAGKGFYDYVDGKRQGLWAGLRGLAGGTPTESNVEFLANRLILAQVAEVGRRLQDGILLQRRDADVGAIFGIGFAPNTGGPLSWMDRRGLDVVVRELDALAARFGERYTPAPVLRGMAERGERFFPAGVVPA